MQPRLWLMQCKVFAQQLKASQSASPKGPSDTYIKANNTQDSVTEPAWLWHLILHTLWLILTTL
jgi:hypothetical protein